MKATIWHNPACGTSRKTLAILQETAGVDVEVVEYLKNSPTVAKLAQLYRAAGITPQQGLRMRGTDAEARGLPGASDAQVLATMAADPRLIERPLVETEKGVRLCPAGCGAGDSLERQSLPRQDQRERASGDDTNPRQFKRCKARSNGN